MTDIQNPIQSHLVAILLIAVGILVAAFFSVLYLAPMVRRFRTRRAGQAKDRRRPR